MKKYETVVFDLDGTLLNTLEDLADATNYALRTMQMPERTIGEVRAFVGNGVRRLMELSVPSGTDSALFETLLAEYNADYAAHCRIETAPYPGVAALLRTLHTQGRKLAIVSNKPDEAVRALRADFFADAVQIAVGETAAFVLPFVQSFLPPDMLLAAMEQLGADPDKTVFVGDSEVDIATARAADLPCISVLWGFRDRDVLEQAGAQQFAADAGELARLLD